MFLIGEFEGSYFRSGESRGMIEGKCPKCGRRCYGWALLQPRNQSCGKCGVGLLITKDGQTVVEGYSPFTADKYSIGKPKDVLKSEQNSSDKSVK